MSREGYNDKQLKTLAHKTIPYDFTQQNAVECTVMQVYGIIQQNDCSAMKNNKNNNITQCKLSMQYNHNYIQTILQEQYNSMVQ